MRRDLHDPVRMVISDSVLTTCAAWGAEVRLHGNGNDARAMFRALIAPSGPGVAMPSQSVEATEDLVAAGGAEGLGRWADDGGARGHAA